jgi:hypothetical protein
MALVCTCHPKKCKKEGHDPGQPGHKYKALFGKGTEAKRDEGMGHVVECLPSKCKALSSNSSTAKKKKVTKTITKLEYEERENKFRSNKGRKKSWLLKRQIQEKFLIGLLKKGFHYYSSSK